ncbi:hypothetical protein [Streptomyces sp. ID05-47C]|uniref:hypothetical protein n=1 Tax=Streptomyces sp. ID05-47C TaxID=3028665 RepID=UPI0029B032D2|nr:hypothetical protein [Streptomyces sp. ID05-47C]MDX3569381.1 hypothetical protein [Streptomyces sp. ID05-47C]
MTDLEWVPQSCTLPTEEQPLRIADWDGLFSEHVTALSRPELPRVRLELSAASGVEDRVRDLADRESGCCSFFTFDITNDDGAVRLDITVDSVHQPVLDALAERAVGLARLGEQR